MPQPILYIFSGLPGSGKTTLARMIARQFQAAYLRIDTIEQGLRELCGIQVEGEGYRLAYRLASENLKAGLSVVTDSCNPITLTRDEWEDVARSAQAGFINIEISCSDPGEHRRRVEGRVADIPGHRLPTWGDVVDREFHTWDRPRITVDTFGRTPEESAKELATLIWEYAQTVEN